MIDGDRIEHRQRRYDAPLRIVQFGEGNFLRAFWGKAIHEINVSGDYRGQIAVVQPIEQGKVELLNAQGCLYTCALESDETSEVVLIESVKEALNPYHDYDRFLALAREDELQVVISNTTEAGIVLDTSDAVDARPPSSFPGKLLAFLYERYRYVKKDAGKGLLLFPCELIEDNGQKLKEVLVALARVNDLEEEFLTWLVEANTFYNTLVDSIVTGFPAGEIDAYSERLGYRDDLLVKAEPYRLLMVQGDESRASGFPIGRSSLDVVWSEDLNRYREIKVKLMNGFQTILSHYGFFCSISTEREAILDPVVGQAMVRALNTLLLPTVSDYRGGQEFIQLMLTRLTNPRIEHVLTDINLNSFTKFQTRVVPSLLYYRDRERLPEFFLFALALVLSYYSVVEKGLKGEWYGVFQGRRYQVYDDAKILEELYRLGAVEQKEDYVRHVMDSAHLWRQHVQLSDDEVSGVAGYMESIRGGDAVDVDLWSSADTMNSE
ncbi:MAG: tagaturonate reductase [Sphaerochaetaceae bacterium]|nr:tagaturonate reductase [Sphaerochaetaceae bacterium]